MKYNEKIRSKYEMLPISCAPSESYFRNIYYIGTYNIRYYQKWKVYWNPINNYLLTDKYYEYIVEEIASFVSWLIDFRIHDGYRGVEQFATDTTCHPSFLVEKESSGKKSIVSDILGESIEDFLKEFLTSDDTADVDISDDTNYIDNHDNNMSAAPADVHDIQSADVPDEWEYACFVDGGIHTYFIVRFFPAINSTRIDILSKHIPSFMFLDDNVMGKYKISYRSEQCVGHYIATGTAFGIKLSHALNHRSSHFILDITRIEEQDKQNDCMDIPHVSVTDYDVSSQLYLLISYKEFSHQNISLGRNVGIVNAVHRKSWNFHFHPITSDCMTHAIQSQCEGFITWFLKKQLA